MDGSGDMVIFPFSTFQNMGKFLCLSKHEFFPILYFEVFKLFCFLNYIYIYIYIHLLMKVKEKWKNWLKTQHSKY